MKLINKIRSSRTIYNTIYWVTVIAFVLSTFLFSPNSFMNWVIYAIAALCWTFFFVVFFYRPTMWSAEDRKKEGL